MTLFLCSNGILLPKLIWPTVRKNCSRDQKNFWNSRLKAQNFTWRIYSNNKRSEQFLVTECFFNLFLEVSCDQVSSDLKSFANSQPLDSIFKSFSRSLEQFFRTVGQNSFGNKISLLMMEKCNPVLTWNLISI